MLISEMQHPPKNQGSMKGFSCLPKSKLNEESLPLLDGDCGNSALLDKVRLMEICASTEAEWESGNVDTGGSSTVTESHSPSAIASDELSLAIGDEDIGHLDEAEKDSESSSDSVLTGICAKRGNGVVLYRKCNSFVQHILKQSASDSGLCMVQVRRRTTYFSFLLICISRDFKFLAQIAMFIFSPYLSEAEIEVWLALPMVFKMVYCDEFKPQKIELYRDVCHRFARAIDCYSVTWRKKLKIHLILHLPDSMLRFWPASSFNTERCGEDLVNLYHTKEVQAFLGGEVQERGSGIHNMGHYERWDWRLDCLLAAFTQSKQHFVWFVIWSLC
eukprot:Em0019g730a